MFGRLARVVVSAAAVGCAALGSAAAAQASDDSIRAILSSDTPKIVHSQARILDGLAAYERTHSVAALIKAITSQDRVLKGLETTLSGQSASTANGLQGRNEIIRGLRLIIGSNRTLTRELRRGAAHKPVSRSKLRAALRADAKGNVDVNAGDKLLGI